MFIACFLIYSYGNVNLVLQTEKCFVESTKIWLTQHNFSFKYGSMEILLELTKKILLIFFFAIPTKKFCIVSKKIEL